MAERYHMAKAEDDRWDIFDTTTDGLVVINGVSLQKLNTQHAEALTDALNHDSDELVRLVNVMLRPASDEGAGP